jgi:hypothetical protein
MYPSRAFVNLFLVVFNGGRQWRLRSFGSSSLIAVTGGGARVAAGRRRRRHCLRNDEPVNAGSEQRDEVRRYFRTSSYVASVMRGAPDE